uniref:Antimicrobial peptide Xac-4 n=1 Tax=Xylocopa violacea TaxID=135666 RepID=XAC4_XYLVO|nr:RecName: Full=Antimicrobial peptide Xac-4; Short=Xac4 [Xylocopa violacea]
GVLSLLKKFTMILKHVHVN